MWFHYTATSRSRRGAAGRRRAHRGAPPAARRGRRDHAVELPADPRDLEDAPALLAGNTVVLKPSPFTPLTTLMLGEIAARDRCPPACSTWSPAATSSAPDDRRIRRAQDLLHRLGRDRQEGRRRRRAGLKRVHARARRQRRRRSCSTTPIRRAIAPKLFWGAFQNCGQVCTAIKRVYVPERAPRRRWSRRSSSCAMRAKVGNGWRPTRSSARSTTRCSSSGCKDLVEDAKSAARKHRRRRRALERCGLLLRADHRRPVSATASAWSTRSSSARRCRSIALQRRRRRASSSANAHPLRARRLGVVGGRRPRRRRSPREIECGTAWVNQHLDLPPTRRSAAPSGAASASRTARGACTGSPRCRR